MTHGGLSQWAVEIQFTPSEHPQIISWRTRQWADQKPSQRHPKYTNHEEYANGLILSDNCINAIQIQWNKKNIQPGNQKFPVYGGYAKEHFNLNSNHTS